MNTLSKIATALIFLSMTPPCGAMDDDSSSLKYQLDIILDTANIYRAGEAFLVVTGDVLGVSKGCTPRDTRNTNFREDRFGNFVNTDKEYLQIIPTDSRGNRLGDTDSASQLITACGGKLKGEPEATTEIVFNDLNLSATAVIDSQKDVAFQVWDSLGVSHSICMNFIKTIANPATWLMFARISPDYTFDNAAFITGIPIVFDMNGNIASIDGSSASRPANNCPQMYINWTNGAACSILTINLGYIGEPGGLSATGATPDLSTPVYQNGRGKSQYVSTTIDNRTRNLIAIFDDNHKLIYGKVAVGIYEIPKIILL